MPGIGEIRVDLVANLAKFQGGMRSAGNVLEQFGTKSSAALKKLEAGLQDLGSKLSIKVTAPLAGLAFAAVKAADPTNQMGLAIKQLKAEAQAALVPLGDVLIRLFRAAQPSIERILGIVGTMADRFASLNPKAQETIVIIAGVAAALGPTLLAMSALAPLLRAVTTGIQILGSSMQLLSALSIAKTVKGVTTAFKSLVTVLKFITTVVVPQVLIGLAVIAAAVAAVEFARYLIDEFKAVRKAWAVFVLALEIGWAHIKFVGRVAWAGVKEVAIEVFASIQSTLRSFLSSVVKAVTPALKFVDGALSHITGKAASASVAIATIIATSLVNEQSALDPLLQKIGDAFSGGEYDLGAAISEAATKRHEDVAKAARRFSDTSRAIEAEFGDNARKGQGFGAFLRGDFTALKENAFGLRTLFKGLIGDSLEFGDEGSKSLKKTAAAMAELKRTSEEDLEIQRQRAAVFTKLGAMQLRKDLFPLEALREEMQTLQEFHRLYPEIIDDDAVLVGLGRIAEKMRQLQDQAVTFRRKLTDAITGFADSASNAFADLVVDGKASFADLLRSWEKTLLAMAFQQYAFQPLFSQLGIFFGSLGAGSTAPGAAGSPTYGPPSSFATASAGLQPAPQTGFGGGTTVQIFDQRSGGQAPAVSEKTGPDGKKTIRIVIRDEVKSMFGDGSLDKSMSTAYGVGRRGAVR